MIAVPDIRQIRIFIALEENRSFTGAASKLHITQSAVSHSLKSLESQLNCKLVERLGKKCILTPHGEVFLHHARQAMQHIENAAQKIQTLNHWGYSSIKLGVSDSISQYVLPRTLASFNKTQPKCEIFISPGDTSDLINLVSKGEIDIAVGIHRQSYENDFNFTPVVTDEMCFVTTPEHEWCKKAPETEEDYLKERFIVYGTNSVTTMIVNAHLSGLGIGIKQRSTLSTGNMESIKEMATLGLGVGIVPKWLTNSATNEGKLVIHDIKPAPRRQWGYYTNKTKSLSLPEEEMMQVFTKEFEKVVQSEAS